MSDFEPLSDEGRVRRERILGVALARAAGKRRWRRLTRGASVVVPALIVAALMLSRPSDPTHPPITRVRDEVPPGVVVVRVDWIETDVTLLDRLAAKPTQNLIERVGDERLLADLSEAGRPAGLVTIDGRAEVVFHDARETPRARIRASGGF